MPLRSSDVRELSRGALASLSCQKGRGRLALYCGCVLTLLLSGVGCLRPHGQFSSSIDTRFLEGLTLTRSFQSGRPRGLRFTPDNAALLFLRSGPRDAAMHLYELDLRTAKTKVLLTPAEVLRGAAERLSSEEKARRERARFSGGG